ncbi:hypothetical protein Aduo_011407 [Ancylostoma duodenale]
MKEEQSPNLARLFAYFNKNATIIPALVPRITYDERSPSQVNLAFQNEQSSFPTEKSESDLKLLTDLVWQVCIDTHSPCEENAVRADLSDVYDFMKNLKKMISLPGMTWRVTLRNLDEQMEAVNWTDYLHEVSPPDVIQYIVPDIEIVTPSAKAMKGIHSLLKNTTGRTITNSVMVMYILSWAELLDENYRSIVDSFVRQRVLSPSPTREDLCLSRAWNTFSHAMIAMHAQLNNERV